MLNIKIKINKIKYIVRNLFLDENEKEFIRLNPPVKKKQTKRSQVVLLQVPMDHYYVMHWKILVDKYFKNGENLIGFSPDFINVYSKETKVCFFQLFVERKINNFFWKIKWQRIYRSIGIEKFVYVKDSIAKKIGYAFEAWKIFKKLERKDDVLNLNLYGLKVGDLVYDTYIRFRNTPTVDINDIYLFFIIYKTFLTISVARKLFEKNNIVTYLSSYSAYIQHGVLVRIALESGVRVYTDGVSNNYCQSMNDKNETSHMFDYIFLPKVLSHSITSNDLELSKNLLKKRFSGLKDPSLQYMKHNPFLSESSSLSDFEGVVFLHDFFDSQHVYRWTLFVDFYEWIFETLVFARKNRLKLAIKPHPNQLPESQDIVKSLKRDFPEFYWLDPLISNIEIFKKKPLFGISVYGTVLFELAYHGIIPISAGDHRFIEYDFVFTPNSIYKYKELILNARNLKLPDKSGRQILEFYYLYAIHNHDSLPSVARKVDLRGLLTNCSGSEFLLVASKKLKQIHFSEE